MRKTLLLASAATLLLAGAAAAQQGPVATTELTVQAVPGAAPAIHGAAKVVLSDNVPRNTGTNGDGTTPKGVYVAGNPVLGYCASDSPAGDPCRQGIGATNQIRSQLIVAGQTQSETSSEHAFLQHYIVDKGGDPSKWVNGYTPGKEGLDTYTVVSKSGPEADWINAPAVWSMNGNLILQPGARPPFAVGIEVDITNDSGKDCPRGERTPDGRVLSYDCHVALFAVGGRNRVTSGVNIGGPGGSKFGLVIGARGGDQGGPFANEADILIEDHAPAGILFERAPVFNGVPIARTRATILDYSLSPSSVVADGNYSQSVFLAASNGTFGFESGGAKQHADFFSNSTTPRGMLIQGSHSLGALIDRSLAPSAVVADGNYSQSVFLSLSNGTFGFESGGAKQHADFFSNSTTPRGMLIQGAHAEGALIENSGTVNGINTPSSVRTFGQKTVATLHLQDAAPAGLRLDGDHRIGLDLAPDRGALTAVNMRSGQAVCWSVNACVSWTDVDGFIFTRADGARIARLDTSGNLRLRGQVIQNTAP